MNKLKIKSDGKLFCYDKKEFIFLFRNNKLPIELFKYISTTSAKLNYKEVDRKTRDRFKQFLKTNNLNGFYYSCCICGFDRKVELCHLTPHSEGGFYTLDNIIPLCPNHHKCFDTNNLYDSEYAEIQRFLVKIITFLIPFYFDCLQNQKIFNEEHVSLY